MQVATVHQFQSLVRGRRKDLNESQESVAQSAGISRKWLSEFERGVTTSVELPIVLKVLAALDLVLDVAATEISGAEEDSEHVDLDKILRDYGGRSR
jgi:HTH-type transcriptional regulator/antitoxin HipB